MSSSHVSSSALLSSASPLLPSSPVLLPPCTHGTAFLDVHRHTDYLSDWPSNPDVLYCRPTKPPGSKVVCVDDGMPT